MNGKKKPYPFVCERENDELFGSATQQTAKGRKTLKRREKEEEDENVNGGSGNKECTSPSFFTFPFYLN